MNIAIITHVTPASPNGLSNYIKCLINSLQEVNKSNFYYIFVNKSFASFLDIKNPRFKLVLIDIPHYPRLFYRPIYFFWQNFLAFKVFNKLKIDLVHLPNPVPLFTKPKKISYVTTIHDMVEVHGLRHNQFHRKFRLFACKSSVKFSELILTVSDYSKNEIIRNLSLDSNKVIRTYPSSTISIEKINLNRKNFKKPFFLHVGGQRNNKNTQHIIKSFINSGLNKEFELRFVGDNKKIQNEMKCTGIHFDGFINEDELVEYYTEAMCLVYPSLNEGFGLPIIEAMSLGTPVITSNIGAMAEVAGDAALLIDPHNESDLIAALKKIASKPKLRDNLKRKGLKRAEFFSWSKCALETINVYEEAIKRFKFA